MSSSDKPSRGALSLPMIVGWAVFVSYVLAARGILNFFPISVFDMYQKRAPSVATRIFVLDARGEASELSSYESFHCAPERPVLADISHCDRDKNAGHIDYVIRDHQLYLDAHTSVEQGGDEVKIVSRAFTLEDRPGSPRFEDCVLARCTARRKGGTK